MRKEEYETLVRIEEEMESCKVQVECNNDYERCELCSNFYCPMNPNDSLDDIF